MLSKLVRILLAAMGVGACGACRGAVAGGMTANPQHQFTMSLDPISRRAKVDYFSNDGQELHIKAVKVKKGDMEFSADSIEITDKSVENRMANVEQMKQDTERINHLIDMLDHAVNALSSGLNAALTPIPKAPGLIATIKGAIGDTAAGAIHATTQPVTP